MEQKVPLTTIKLRSSDEPHRISRINPPNPWIRYVVGCVAVASLIGVVILALMLAIPISMIAIGARYRHFYDCPIETRISHFLIVGGSTSLVWIVLTIVVSLLTMFVAYTRSLAGIIGVLVLTVIIFCLQIFSFIWLIVGSVWTFRIRNYVQFKDSSRINYCNPVLYRGTVAILIITLLWPFIQCCLSCFRQCISRKQN